MSQQDIAPIRRRWLSLPARIAIGFIIATFIPLVIMFIYISFITRPALITQANNAMASDAQTRVQLIDTYFGERLLDTQTLTQVPSVQAFVLLPYIPESADYQDALLHAEYALQAGSVRDKRYADWSLFTSSGQLRAYYPLANKPEMHGANFFTDDQLKKVNNGETFISPVYYSQKTHKAAVDIYAPMKLSPTPYNPKPPNKVIGFMRATLYLDYIYQDVVAKDQGIGSGSGSYAFILDDNGVRVVDTDRNRLFTSVTPIPDDIQQQISHEQRYGGTDAVKVIADPKIANENKSPSNSAIFATTPAQKNEPFQVVRYKSTVLPWNYFVLSPESAVTSLANEQQKYTLIIAIAVSALAAIIGIIVGKGLARPILQSVNYLQGNSTSLTTLATSQQEAASEQVWVVDSSQVGLQSVQYYTEAIKVASTQLRETAIEMAQHWNNHSMSQVNQALERIIQTTQYIENATEFQNTSNQKLSTALKVATQVTEQLHMGATSATEAATQLEKVVNNLQGVVGR